MLSLQMGEYTSLSTEERPCLSEEEVESKGERIDIARLVLI